VYIFNDVYLMMCKGSASREKHKMNSFIFVSKAQPIFAFDAKVIIFPTP